MTLQQAIELWGRPSSTRKWNSEGDRLYLWDQPVPRSKVFRNGQEVEV